MMETDCHRPAPSKPFSPNEIILYGIKVGEWVDGPNPNPAPPTRKEIKGTIEPSDVEDDGHFEVDVVFRKAAKPKPVNPDVGQRWRMAAVYGYAYEGHCYALDRPKLMIFEATDDEDVPAAGCGYDSAGFPDPARTTKSPAAVNYMMWRLGKRQEIYEFALNAGFAEQLILEANKVGQRSPLTYAAHMQVAHRAGRLTT